MFHSEMMQNHDRREPLPSEVKLFLLQFEPALNLSFYLFRQPQ
ncbi:hypothetical protein GEOBRER4_n0586 [Citrifermentans bremense]|uniref:Uncharacterized protein n=1 Tax=Citrifermentans bremense TaxID=60035 RepID=A0A7R7J008_9BACT|nr:hypothetical protein GEOBRER4_n0586 [Citrifermentans bremense]